MARSLAAGCFFGAVILAPAAAGADGPRSLTVRPAEPAAIHLAQTSAPFQGKVSRPRRAQISQAQAQCRMIARQLHELQNKNCIRGDLLDRTRSLCVPPKGIFKAYSLWDPAAGRCKPRHRFDGGTCAGGKRRYRAGKQYAHQPAQSMTMYANAPARLAAAHKQCRLGMTDLRSRIAAERIARQRNCAAGRQHNDRNMINLYCK